MRFAIPAGTYPGQADAVPTVATQAALVAAEAMTPAEVAALLGSCWKARASPGPAGRRG